MVRRLAALAASLVLLAAASARVQAATDAPAGTELPAADAAPRATQVDGLWCGTGPLRDFSLRLKQEEQHVEGELARRGRVRTIEGTVDGNVVRTQATKVGALVLEKDGEELKVTDGDGMLALVRGTSFKRTEAAGCTG